MKYVTARSVQQGPQTHAALLIKPQAQQKYWQELIGQVGGGVRRPLLNLNDDEKAEVKAAFADCGLKLSLISVRVFHA